MYIYICIKPLIINNIYFFSKLSCGWGGADDVEKKKKRDRESSREAPPMAVLNLGLVSPLLVLHSNPSRSTARHRRSSVPRFVCSADVQPSQHCPVSPFDFPSIVKFLRFWSRLLFKFDSRRLEWWWILVFLRCWGNAWAGLVLWLFSLPPSSLSTQPLHLRFDFSVDFSLRKPWLAWILVKVCVLRDFMATGWRSIWKWSDERAGSQWEGLQWKDSHQTRLQNGLVMNTFKITLWIELSFRLFQALLLCLLYLLLVVECASHVGCQLFLTAVNPSASEFQRRKVTWR